MEEPEARKTPRYRLAKATMKVRLVNRALRGKCLWKVAPDRSTRGHVVAANRHPPFKRRGTSRKLAGRKKPLRKKLWWSFDTETKAMCLLYLFIFIVGVQFYNAYENLDDNLMIYNIDQLEKTLYRDILGQTLALNKLAKLMRSYFATYIHAKPLFLSINGPAGVGKSHLGRLIAKHFKFEIGPHLVLQRSMKYQQLGGHSNHYSQDQLATHISAIFSRALQDERIPVFLFDDMELAPLELLSFIGDLLHSNHTNAVYIFISNIGQELIMQSIRCSFTHKATARIQRLSVQLAQLFKQRHPVWQAPAIIPLCPLERAHVVQCIHQLMDQNGFYPHDPHVEMMANMISYYRTRQKLYAQQGCRGVPSMVKQLIGQQSGEQFRKNMALQHIKHDGIHSQKTFSRSNHSETHD
ncbi:torsin-4A-B-like [Heterodontus francisci]|uniref:torsin-4A-B-like n=1 Tax=Heterodontus francisci TaxID=7792 RepID=UPI00355B6011